MKRKIEHWLAPSIILIGEVILLTLFFFAPSPYHAIVVLKSVESTFAPVRFFLVIPLIAVGLGILSYITIIFFMRYRKSPNETRFVVMTSLLNLTISMLLFFFDTTWRFTEKIIKEYLRSLSIYFLEFSIYFLILFGLNILITLEKGKKGKGLKILLNVLLFMNYGLYFVGEAESILTHEEDPGTLIELADYSQYIIVAVSIALLVIMAYKSLSIQKSTKDEKYRAGLKALGSSFIFIIFAILTGIIERFVDFEVLADSLRVGTVILAIIGFLFIYLGFVKPAREDTS